MDIEKMRRDAEAPVKADAASERRHADRSAS
jgi:hypothetical protein